MQIGLVGLGKMGGYMVERLMEHQHTVVAYDINVEARKQVAEKEAETVNSLAELVHKLSAPRTIWIMVPAGAPTEETIRALSQLLSTGDILIDGGNSYYRDSINRAEYLKEKGIYFLDVGTSGGIWGLKIGYCLMIGGEKEIFKKLEPIFKALAPKDGYAYVGKNGAGHYVKMVHNGIEYGMLEAYAEGFEILNAKKEFNFDFRQISHLWNQGSVIRSWLLELAEDAFKQDPKLASVAGYVEDSGEGRWTVDEAINENVPAPVITLSLLQRLRSRQQASFSAKVIAALRHEFGGHAIKKE